MPTSKLPVREAPVPAAVIAFAADRPKIGVNLRLRQRPAEEQQRDFRRMSYDDDAWIYRSAGEVIAGLSRGTKFLMLFQGYGDERLGVACVELLGGYGIGSAGCIRLDFVHPSMVDEIHGCPNFWAPFILAIMVVDPATPVFAEEDDMNGSKFIEHATRLS